MNLLLSSALTAPIEALLNAVLAQDPVAAARLGRLHGKAIEVTCTSPLPWQVFLIVQHDRIAFRVVYEDAPDAGIRGSASAFSRLALSSNETDSLFSPAIQLSGDTHLIQEIHAIIAGLEIDWEDHFGRIFGDVATHQLGQLFTRGRAWSSQARDTLLADIEEYIHEEARILPGRSEVNHFSTRVDDLKLAIDRLAARQARLRATLEPAPQ